MFWETGLFSNVRLLAVVIGSALAQLAIHHIPATQALFQIGTLTMQDCAISLLLGLVPVTVIELSKLARRKR